MRCDGTGSRASSAGSGWVRRTVLVGMLALVCAAGASALTIKLGTLAPANTPWDLVLRRLAAEWSRISDGEVEMKIFPGGIAGSEPDMIRKMRIGQLQAAALTAGSINSDIYPGAQVLDMPLLIRTDAEMHAVLEAVTPHFDKELEQRGFVALMWAHIGWVKLFSRTPVNTTDDLRGQPLWVGNVDAEEIRVWQGAGFNVVALPVTELTTALQSGMIDAFFSSPLAAAAFQWFGIAPHMNDLKIAPLYAGLIITKRTWERIPADLRPRFRAVAQVIAEQLSAGAREQDDLAQQVMQAHGLQVHAPTAELEQDWKELGTGEFRSLVGDVIDPEVYRLVTERLAAFRAGATGD